MPPESRDFPHSGGYQAGSKMRKSVDRDNKMRTGPKFTGSHEGRLVGEQAKRILGILTRHAEGNGESLTYADLERETGIATCALRAPLERLSAALATHAKSSKIQTPPLQALIVNSKTGVPGAGAWRHFGKQYVGEEAARNLTAVEQKKIIRRIHSDIARFQDWPRVERELTAML